MKWCITHMVAGMSGSLTMVEDLIEVLASNRPTEGTTECRGYSPPNAEDIYVRNAEDIYV